MTDELESQLRAAFTERADRIAPDREARLRSIDYSRSRLRPWNCLRAWTWPARLGVSLATVGVLGGAAFAATQLIPRTAAYEVPAFACEVGHATIGNIPAVTGDPVEDCATAWPQFTHGGQAPRLVIRSRVHGPYSAVVTSVGDSNPYGGSWAGWVTLPDSWHTNLKVTALSDQLDNITLPLAGGTASAEGQYVVIPCTYEASDMSAIRRLFRSDGLRGWHVTVFGTGRDGNGHAPYLHGCYSTGAMIDASKREVGLTQFAGSGHPSPEPPDLQNAVTSAAKMTAPHRSGLTTVAPSSNAPARVGHRQRRAAVAETMTSAAPSRKPSAAPVAKASENEIPLMPGEAAAEANSVTAFGELRSPYARVNRMLDARCESVPQATALWTRIAASAGFSAAQPSFWKPLTESFTLRHFRHYLLYTQPASQHTGNCAHVLVMGVPGEGIADVYIARITP